MASDFRPTAPHDAAELAALAERLLGVAPDNPMFSEAHMRWKYWTPWPGWAGSRSYVLTREGRIVAHAGVLPLTTHVSGRSVRLLHPFDWMSEPSAIGSGAALLKRLAALADGLLIVGGSEMTQRMARPLGFRALGSVSRYAATASGGAGSVRIDALPSVLPQILAGCTVSRAPRVEAADCEQLDDAPPWLSFERSPELLNEYLRCPVAEMAAYSARSPAGPLGFFLIAQVPAQARIVAFWPRSTQPADHALLLELARRQAAAGTGVDEVVCMANAPADTHALRSAGFREAGSVPMFLLASPSLLDAETCLRFQMLEGDVAFLHHGAPQPWL